MTQRLKTFSLHGLNKKIKMNDRINKLWEQAARRDDLMDQTRHERFAESIIRECAGIVDNHGRWILYDKLAVKIKKDFGIE
jgi:arginine/ornithine N-succinyltransferase beta subunit